MAAPLKIAMVAGEASGDILGAALMSSILKQNPTAQFEGIGGTLMCALGFKSLYPMETLSVMGFIEPLKRLPALFRVKNGLVNHFTAAPPDVFIGIDSPDFNLGVEKALKQVGVTTVHYVSPSVWAWRQGRIKGIKKAVDLMLCLLPFEADYYHREQVAAIHVGHPMADAIAIKVDKSSHQAHLGLSTLENSANIAILPGSRMSEVEKMAPIFFAVAERIWNESPESLFLVPAASEKLYAKLSELAGSRSYVRIIKGKAREVLGAADAAMVASGTATLEALLMKCPMVVAYRMDWLTYGIAKLLVKTKYIALANLVADKLLVKERIQAEAKVDILYTDMHNLLVKGQAREQLINEFEQIHQRLKLQASDTAARAILDLVRSRQ